MKSSLYNVINIVRTVYDFTAVFSLISGYFSYNLYYKDCVEQ